MTKKENVSNNLRPHRIPNDNADLNKVIVMIQETINPFDVNLDPEKLYNISTGLAAMDSTQLFLLNVFKNGKNERKKFIEECSQNSLRFEKPIKRQKIISFATQTGTQKITVSRKSFISMFNARFVWDHFIHIVIKKGWYGPSAKVSLNSCSLIFKSYRWHENLHF